MKFLVLLSLSLSCSAKVPHISLVKEFVEKNIDIQNSKRSTELKTINRNILDETNKWGITAASTYTDSSLDLSSGASNKNKNHQLSISKKFGFGGELTFTNSLLDYDYTLGTSTDIKIFSQQLSYSQDVGNNFFGKKFDMSRDILTDQISRENLNAEYTLQEKSKEFIITIYDMKLAKTLEDFQKKAVERARRRFLLVKKRVSDGLREKVDLYQSEMALLSQKEALKDIQDDLNKLFTKASSMLHRKVLYSEIEKVSLGSSKDLEKPQIKKIDNNLRYKISKYDSNIAKKEIQLSERLLLPKVLLNTYYKTNDYDEKVFKSFSNGNFSQNQNEISVGVSVTFPIGFYEEKEKVAKSKVNFEIANAKERKILVLLKEKESEILKSIDSYYDNLKLAKKRLTLARLALKDFNRLYSRGRADLDQVISAEESLLGTEKSFLKYQVLKEKKVLDLYSLYGEFSNLLNL